MSVKWQPLSDTALQRMLAVAADRLGISMPVVRVQYGTLYLTGTAAAIYAWDTPEAVRHGRSVIVSEAGESLRLPAEVLYADHVARFNTGERG